MKKSQKITLNLIALIVCITTVPSSQGGISDPFPKPEISFSYKALPIEKWQDTESGRFAHSLQYEDKLAKPVPYQFTPGKDYRQESIDYFEHLCTTEGKDYIYKTVTGVDTIAQLRSFEIPYDPNVPAANPQAYKYDRYALEAPVFFDEVLSGLMNNIKIYDDNDYKKISISAVRAFYGISYTNYEVIFNNGAMYNFKRDYEKLKSYKDDISITEHSKILQFQSVEKISKISAQYGFTWRGFNRLQDREYGISGGDLIILNLKSMEILGIQRTFIKGNIQKNSPTGLGWEGIGCFKQYEKVDNFNFEGKTFAEKAKLINYKRPSTKIIPLFIHTVIISSQQ